ncbi:ABC transporter permease [Raoultibacter phocaeensis]|uniref:ABC transporter permease n=1 Tax=Raoultibacter phocaeensis TaxID=2479841 RepID=UPI00111AC9E5|nr:ABC transporter permease [Raoultibacter phocaeensis]
MSVMTSFTLRSLKKNRVRTVVSVVGIALSCALITAVFTSVTSLQAGLLERTLATEGSWQIASSQLSENAYEEFLTSDTVVDMAVSHELGSAKLTPEDSRSMGEFVAVKTYPDTVKGTFAPGGTPLTLVPELEEGRLPESDTEVVLPDYCKGVVLGEGVADAGAVSDGALEVGSALTLHLGTRMVEDANGGGQRALDSFRYGYLSPETGYPSEEELVDASTRTYTVVGFYERQSNFGGSDFTASNSSIVALTSADASSGGIISAYLTVQGLSSTAEMQAFVNERITEADAIPMYHVNLFRYQGIADGRPIEGTLWMIAIVLTAVIVVASVSLIYNSFAISVADRTRQFGLLSSIGASKKQIRRSVLFEAFFLGLIGVPVGVLVGIGGVAAVFALTQEAFTAMIGTGGSVSLHVEPVVLAVVVLLSAVTLLASAWVPAQRAGKVSAVDAIRQTQDVKVSKRAARRARAAGAKAAKRGTEVPAGVSGLSGKLFGAPGFIAHRNLSRASARGRTVVASLAVSVALIVVSGSVALYLTPIADRAESKNAAGSGADIIVSGSAPEMAELSAFSAELDEFKAQAEKIGGIEFLSSYKQGQADAALPAAMISEDGRMVGDDIDEQQNASFVPSSFSSNGDYLGDLTIFYLDDKSWTDLVKDLGLDEAAFTDPANPQAIGLNRYQGIIGGDSYADAKPFAATGPIDLYAIDYNLKDDAGSWGSMGVRENASGNLVVGYVNQYSEEEPEIIEKPVEEVASKTTIEVGALTDEVPASVNSGSASIHFPVILLPESVAGSAAGIVSPSGERGVFDYYWTNLSFGAENHAEAAEALEELAKQSELLDFRVFDVTESARQSRLIAQAVQLFIACFAVIMLLISVANVFNTLTNSIILRTREFAMLKSAGMGDRAFARMLVYECASYAVRGLAIGLAVALGATYLLYWAVNLSFTGLVFALPWGYVGVAVAVVLAVLALSVAFALRRSHASSVVDALRADAV